MGNFLDGAVKHLVKLSLLVGAVFLIASSGSDSAQALKVSKWVNWQNADTMNKVRKCRGDRDKCCEAVGGQPQYFKVLRTAVVTKTRWVTKCSFFGVFMCHKVAQKYRQRIHWTDEEWRCVKGHAYFTTSGPGGSLIASLPRAGI